MGCDFDPTDLCRRYGSSILRRCRALLRDVHEAEDATQEVFVSILTKGHQFRGEAEIGTWIYRLTTNLCLNRMRSDRRRRARDGADCALSWTDIAPTDPYQHYVAKSLMSSIAAESDALNQQVLVFKYLDGMTQDEIASVTGKSRRTIGKRLKQIEASISRQGWQP